MTTCFYHHKRVPCGKPASHAVVVGPKPDEEYGANDTFYTCREHLSALIDRAKENGYPVISVAEIKEAQP